MRFLTGVAGLATLASMAMADITFNVVGYPSVANGAFGVSINGAITKLVANEHTFPVWTGAVPGTAGNVVYSYVELNAAGGAVKTEAFTRTLHNQSETATYNEFFERPTTKWELPHVPFTYLATWPSGSKAMNDEIISTFHVTADPAQLAALSSNPEADTDIKVTVRFITHKVIHTQQNITFSTSGKSSRLHKKQAYKFKFDGDYNQTFFHRPNIKLRSQVMDPTYLREKLYIDMLNSVGVPTQQAGWSRLYINQKPYGLYLMVDDIKKSFIKQTVYSGADNLPVGALHQMNAPVIDNQADLVYKGAGPYDPVVYKTEQIGTNPPTAPLTQLIKFMADLAAFDPISTPNPVEYWTSRLDLDGFLRNMAMEYLGGAWDNYWMSGSNYFFYFNPTLGPNGKWQWLPTDFDGTFGNGFPVAVLSSYKTYYNGPQDHPLVSKLILKNAQIGAMFQAVLKETVSTAFKPEALFPRIDMYNKMLSEEVKWDKSIVRTGPGLDNGYTFEDFNNNLNVLTKDMSYAVKPWIKDLSDLIAKEQAFAIPAGIADRVTPPPKPKDDKPDGEKDGDSGKGGAGGKNAGSALTFSAGLVAVMAMMASASAIL